MLDGKNLYNAKGILMISVGVMVSGIVIMYINSILWLKYTLICAIIICLIIFRKKMIPYVINILSGKTK